MDNYTAWSVVDTGHNHIELGWASGHKPEPKFKSQKSWKGNDWVKKHGYLDSNNIFVEEKEDEKHLISCIGIDRKQHVCYPWKDVTECGVKILKKKMTDSDYTEHFGCYECTY